jgi:SLT domain-containing protein
MFSTAFQANAFQNNAFQIYVPPSTGKTGGDDAWVTPDELKRIKRLQQKIAERQRKIDQSLKDANASRKQAFKDLIDPAPVAKVKKAKVQSKQEVKADIPSVNTQDLQRSISYLENQLDNILTAVAYRQEAARIQAELEMLEAKRQEELDDENALLLLLH